MPGREKRDSILEEVRHSGADKPYPVKVLTPPIYDDDPFRDFYFRWSVYPRLSRPGNYHNGGIWPFVGGFYVMALKKAKRDFQNALESLAGSNRIGKHGEYEFNEWISDSGEPEGSAFQSWSAGMYVLAYQVSKGRVRF